MEGGIISANVDYDNCVLRSDWNAYECTNPLLGVLLFDSLDDDRYDRTVSPITITKSGDTRYSNVLNTQMDHVWDGFYTGQLRQSRFPAQIEAEGNYTI